MKNIKVLILGFVVASSGAYAIGDWLDSSFAVPTECGHPIGIAWDGTYLYLNDINDGDFFVLNEDGSLVDSYVVGTGLYIGGLTYDEDSEHLWGVAFSPDFAYEIDPANGNILSSFALHASNTAPHSIAYYNNNLYISNDTAANSRIYIYNTAGALQSNFLSFAKYPAGLDIIENSGTDYIFNLGYADGFFVLHELAGTAHPEFNYLTSSPITYNYAGDVAFKEPAFVGGEAHIWHVDNGYEYVNYLHVDWETGIKSASLGEIKALFR